MADTSSSPAARTGRAVIRAYLNLRTVPLTPATVVFDATRRAGMAMDLAMRIRRHGRLSYGELAQFAALAAIPETDLRLAVIPALERSRMLEVSRDEQGRPTEVEEQIGIRQPVLEEAAAVWEAFGAQDIERCAIASSDLLSYVPLGKTAHQAALEKQGFAPALHEPALKALRAVGMLRSSPSPALHEPVLYSPYVWGTEAVPIAEFMQRLPANEREVLAGLSRTVAEHPGSSVEGLAPSDALLTAARKVGLIDATRVLTTAGAERAFAFSPAVESQLSAGSTDVAHERKLFVAHILYGHRYGYPGTGRIEDPVVLVSALVNRGRVGPASAIRTDYPLLEAQGIVRVREEPSGMAYLELVKNDVAADALDMLRMALGEGLGGRSSNPIESLWIPGAFISPEQDRVRLPEIEPGAEAEVLQSTIDRLREETARRMRAEEV